MEAISYIEGYVTGSSGAVSGAVAFDGEGAMRASRLSLSTVG